MLYVLCFNDFLYRNNYFMEFRLLFGAIIAFLISDSRLLVLFAGRGR
jgi:hypothetical protein